MRLYLIRRKADQQYFVHCNGHYSVHTGKRQERFAPEPQMFLKTADGVAGNLRKLCSEPFMEEPHHTGWSEIGWRNFDKSRLDLYEIVIMNVDIISMTATPAKKFIQIEAIENKPLNRRERAAA